MAISRYTYTLKEPNGRKFKVVGTGTNIADAKAEADATLAITVGTAVSATKSEADAAAAGGGAGSYSDVTVVFRKGTNYVTKHLENVSNANAEVVDGSPTGKLDPDVGATLAAAFKDGAGAGGYSFDHGYFTN